MKRMQSALFKRELPVSDALIRDALSQDYSEGRFFDRRKFIAGCGMALAGAVPVRSFAAAAFDVPLKLLGKRCGISVGTTLNSQDLQNHTLCNLITSEFSQITPGMALKWPTIRKSPFQFDFFWSDQILNFAKENHLSVHGHNLCWDISTNPSWMKTTINKFNARHYLEEHIATVVGRYRGRIPSWDVVNEPISYRSTRPDMLRSGVWFDSLNEEYLDIAFDACRRADPSSVRVMNFTGLEQPGDWSERACAVVLDTYKKLLKRGVPIQAIGFESHLSGHLPIGSRAFENLIHGLRELGMQIMITEMDVNDTKIKGTPDERHREVGKVYEKYLSYMLPLANPTQVSFWNPSDLKNSYDSMLSTNPEWKRADGGLHYPGLTDSQYRPNPAFYAVKDVFSECASHTGVLPTVPKKP